MAANKNTLLWLAAAGLGIYFYEKSKAPAPAPAAVIPVTATPAPITYLPPANIPAPLLTVHNTNLAPVIAPPTAKIIVPPMIVPPITSTGTVTTYTPKTVATTGTPNLAASIPTIAVTTPGAQPQTSYLPTQNFVVQNTNNALLEMFANGDYPGAKPTVINGIREMGGMD
jgi:hypothetical protein